MPPAPPDPDPTAAADPTAVRPTVTRHYARHGRLSDRIAAVLRDAGQDPADPDALAPLEQMHLGGPESTRALAEAVALRDAAVLDVGCGIGGPARMLARCFGCTVTGIDLTEAYVQDAAALSRRVGLDDRTRFACASALDLPFADAGFPWVWTQHAAMNIPDKARLYAEVARVLAPGGRFALHDIVAGPLRDPHFPVPWASDAAGSFLLPANEIWRRVRAAGLVEVFWEDRTAAAVQGVREAKAARQAGEPDAPGPHSVMGPEFLEMRRNLARNLEEGRVAVVRALFEKPAG
jgi:SAM-dependent methyltransferase